MLIFSLLFFFHYFFLNIQLINNPGIKLMMTDISTQYCRLKLEVRYLRIIFKKFLYSGIYHIQEIPKFHLHRYMHVLY